MSLQEFGDLVNDTIQIISVPNEESQYLSINIHNWIEKGYYFLALCKDNNVTIQRYYWRSKLDNTYIEYLKPKVTDVFYMVIDVIGDLKDLMYVKNQYLKVQKMLEKLVVC